MRSGPCCGDSRGLVPYLHDERDAWELGPEGGYRRVSETGISAQRALMQRFGERLRGLHLADCGRRSGEFCRKSQDRGGRARRNAWAEEG